MSGADARAEWALRCTATTGGSARGPERAVNKASVILLAALVGHLVLWTAAMRAKDQWTFDETISFLAATGHQGEFNHILGMRRPPYGVWSPARAWQALVQPEEAFAFSQIRH